MEPDISSGRERVRKDSSSTLGHCSEKRKTKKHKDKQEEKEEVAMSTSSQRTGPCKCCCCCLCHSRISSDDGTCPPVTGECSIASPSSPMASLQKGVLVNSICTSSGQSSLESNSCQAEDENEKKDIIHILQPFVSSSEDPESLPPNMILRVGTMQSLVPGEYTSCPFSMEEFDKDSLEYLPPGSCFVQNDPSYCIGRLSCGHHFHAVSILYHMAINGMNCPLCRCVLPT